jgi:hypothetical protein
MAKKAATRELIDTGSDLRYVRRGSGGQFNESAVRQLAFGGPAKKAQAKVKCCQGDKGDR